VELDTSAAAAAPITHIRTGYNGDGVSCSVEIAQGVGNNRKLVAIVTQERTPATISAPTFNSVTGTLVTSINETGSSGNLHVLIYEWNDAGANSIAALPASAGTYTLETTGVVAEIAISGISCSGAKQTACVVPSPSTASGFPFAGDDPSFTITADVGSLAIIGIVDNTGTQTMGPGADQIPILPLTNAGNSAHASSYNPTSLTVGYMREVETSYAAAAAAIEPAGASGPTITDVNGDDTIAPGQASTVTGTGLAAGASAQVTTGTKTLVMDNYVADDTAPEFDAPPLQDWLDAGIKFGSATFEILS
jgi:hypothetical protein